MPSPVLHVLKLCGFERKISAVARLDSASFKELDLPLTCSLMMKHRWQGCGSNTGQLFRKLHLRSLYKLHLGTLYARSPEQAEKEGVDTPCLNPKAKHFICLCTEMKFWESLLLPVPGMWLPHSVLCSCSCQNYKLKSLMKLKEIEFFSVSGLCLGFIFIFFCMADGRSVTVFSLVYALGWVMTGLTHPPCCSHYWNKPYTPCHDCLWSMAREKLYPSC